MGQKYYSGTGVVAVTIELHFEQVIPVPRELAWRAFHEEIEALAPWLPHVEHIRVLTRRTQGGGPCRFEHVWGLDPSVIPQAARPFLGDVLRELRSSTLWHHDLHHVDFRFFLDSVEDLVECDGRFLLESDGEHTRITISAELEIYPHVLPGVPKFLGKTVRPAVKRVIEETLSPTLEALPDALTRLMERRSLASATA